VVKILFTSFFIVLSSFAFGATASSMDDSIVRLSQGSYWLRLLHYEKSFWGGYRSRVEGEEFFFAKDGKTNPTSEMKETLSAFNRNMEVGRLKQHPQCAFPERYRYLKESLNLKTQDVDCPKLKEYLAKFDPESVTLVFSSAYPHNPGSMFGHTFLRINSRAKDRKKQDLLDWGISYAAQVAEDENGFAFVYFGLTGGYRGQFSLLPYYAKVNEYVNNESRDLWEYELNLNREETYRLLRNIWEIETNTYFKYYFLDENCSYLLLAFLEVAKPEWHLMDKFPIYVIPGETVKAINDIPGAVTQVKYRPSLQKKMMRNYELLNSAQKDSFHYLIAQKMVPSEVNDAKTLDSVSDYLLYVKKKKDNELSPEENRLFRAVLLKRSKLGQVAGEAESDSGSALNDPSRPDLAHDTFRLGLSSGVESRGWIQPRSQSFQELQFKFAFHDLLNCDLGYTPFSQVDFPTLTLRYYNKSQQIRFENIHILSLTSLSPLKALEKHPSWTFHLEYLSPKDLTCDHCQVFHFDLGGGLTLGIGSENAVLYSLWLGQFEAGNSFRLGYRFLPKWQVGSVIKVTDAYKVQLLSNWVWDLFQRDRRGHFFEFQVNQSLALGRTWDLRLTLQSILNSETNSSFHEGKFSVHYYF
jgi:hypothetical protein